MRRNYKNRKRAKAWLKPKPSKPTYVIGDRVIIGYCKGIVEGFDEKGIKVRCIHNSIYSYPEDVIKMDTDYYDNRDFRLKELLDEDGS